MIQKNFGYFVILGIFMLAGCAGDAGIPGASAQATSRPFAVETDTGALVETEAAAVETQPVDPLGSTPTAPQAVRPLLTAPVVEPPRIARDVTPDSEAVAGVLDPIKAGIPVMPGAVNRQEGATTIYRVSAQLSEVEAWYQAQMTALGWKLDNRRLVTATSPGGEGIRLEYGREKMRAVVLLEYLAAEQVTQVSLRLGEN